MKKKHTIPTIIGLLIILIGVGAGVFMLQKDLFFKTEATPGQTPREIKITNITAVSFTVSWITSQRTRGFVSYGETKQTNLTTQSTPPSLTHHINIENLKPNTQYFFKIGSDDQIFDNNGQPYQIITGPTITTPLAKVISGIVLSAAGAPQPGAIVYINIDGGSPLSTTTNSNGEWSKNLGQIRTANLQSPLTINDNVLAKIFVQAGNGKIASATIRIGAARFTPPLKIGEHKDLSQIQTTKEGEEIPSSTLNLPDEQKQSRFKLPDETGLKTGTKKPKVALLVPNYRQAFSTARPIFRGTGEPGTQITITVESPKTITDNILVKADGTWSWIPPKNLSEGEHTITLLWTENGEAKTITQPFIIASAANAEQKTSSATPTATPSNSITSSTTESTPVSGDLTPTITAIIMGLLLVTAGLLIPRFLKF